MSLEVGDRAPEFSLKNQSGEMVSLADFAGKKNVLVMFYPFAFSGICTGEICEINEDLPKFQNDDVEMISISCDPHHALRAFAEKENIKTILLSDFWPHGAVAKEYGVFLEDLGFANRGTFLIDKSGNVRWKTITSPGEARVSEEYKKALAAIS
ncbi:MAG: peroxiredoxin [Candidatus Nanopelagicales bacterium]